MGAVVRLKRNSTPGLAPSTSALADGEVALNTTDGVLYFKKTVGNSSSLVSITDNKLTNGLVSVTLNGDGSLTIGQNTIPPTTGTAGQSLLTDGTGQLYWGSPTASAINANGTLSMPVLTAQPSNLEVGQIAMADGSSWDPLTKKSGPYLIIYTGTAWVDIGGITLQQVQEQIILWP